MAAESRRRLVVRRALDLARNQQVRGKQSRDLQEGGSIVSALPQAQSCLLQAHNSLNSCIWLCTKCAKWNLYKVWFVWSGWSTNNPRHLQSLNLFVGGFFQQWTHASLEYIFQSTTSLRKSQAHCVNAHHFPFQSTFLRNAGTSQRTKPVHLNYSHNSHIGVAGRSKSYEP